MRKLLLLILFSFGLPLLAQDATTENAPSNEGAKAVAEAPKPVDPLDMNPVLKLIARINGLGLEMARLEARYPKAKEEQQAAVAELNALTLKLRKTYKAPPGWIFDDNGEWGPNPNAAPAAESSGVSKTPQTEPNP